MNPRPCTWPDGGRGDSPVVAWVTDSDLACLTDEQFAEVWPVFGRFLRDRGARRLKRERAERERERAAGQATKAGGA